MPFAETPLRDEYTAALEGVAGRTLVALRDGEACAALVDPDSADPRPLLAAVRILGADLFAPQLLTGAPPDGPTAALLAEARRILPTPTAGSAEAALVIEWQDWAADRLLARTPYGEPAPRHAPSARPNPLTQPDPLPYPNPLTQPAPLPGPGAVGWQAWSVRMAQLSVLALPGLDDPVHDGARAHPLELARGTVRSMLRRDHTTAARLARWLAWLTRTGAEGHPLPLDVEPALDRIRLAGDGSARTALELAIAHRLLDPTSPPTAERGPAS